MAFKTEYVTLFAAVLAAVASLGGILLNQRGALDLEREKWLQAKSDLTDKALADFVRDFESALHSGRWLVWRAENAPASLRASDLDEYNKHAKSFLPTLSAQFTQLGARSEAAATELGPIYSDLGQLDECIAKASLKGAPSRIPDPGSITACGQFAFRIGNRSQRAFSRAAQAARGAKFAEPPESGSYKW